MESIRLYIKESYNELINKVTWPTWSSLLSTTNVVIIASIIFSLLTSLMDFFSKLLLDQIYGI